LQNSLEKIEEINKNISEITNYGGTTEIEFLALARECFFEKSKLLKRKYLELFRMLEAYFVG
jgi:hypothetical protein